jgi:transcriptional regulator with XRE-family HTH domain
MTQRYGWKDAIGLRRPLGRRVALLREAVNLTQAQLAARAGLSLDAVKAIERGRRPDPRVSTLLRLAAGLCVTVDVMLNEERG